MQTSFVNKKQDLELPPNTSKTIVLKKNVIQARRLCLNPSKKSFLTAEDKEIIASSS